MAKEKEKVQVGAVNVTTLKPGFGKVVKRVPVFEGDDPEQVRAEANAEAEKERKRYARALARAEEE